ncbi:hypothetical protein TYRP_019537 [Tyrophagus putrescentiae]|nr:hypothetical protein TYRP_019537 [Tyrophagus putrescentiae]
MYQKAPTGVAYSTAIPPKFFSVKKVILLLAMILEAARTIVYMIIVTARAGELLKHLKPANTKENRKILAMVVYIGGSLNLAYLLLMTVVVLRRHLTLLTTLTVLQALSVIGTIVLFIVALFDSAKVYPFGVVNYIGLVSNLLLTALLYLYLRDVRLIRDQERPAYQSVSSAPVDV